MFHLRFCRCISFREDLDNSQPGAPKLEWKRKMSCGSDDQHVLVVGSDYLDSANQEARIELNEIPRRSKRQTKPTNRLSLSTWMYFVATMPQSLINIKELETTALITYYNREIFTSTRNNLIKDMCPF